MGDDAAMLSIVSSANVACGFHAGDATGILETLKKAKANNVVVGAHVAYPRLGGFWPPPYGMWPMPIWWQM